jgi:hypothetical protein
MKNNYIKDKRNDHKKDKRNYLKLIIMQYFIR